MKKKRRRYRTTRRFAIDLKLPTTTVEAKRQYMREYMRDLRGVTPDRYGKRGRKPKKKVKK